MPGLAPRDACISQDGPGSTAKSPEPNDRAQVFRTDLHPCMQTALEPHGVQEDMQQFQWLLCERLESHKAALEAMLQEHAHATARQVAHGFQHFEAFLLEQHRTLDTLFEASKLHKQQEERLEERMDRFLQERSSMEMLSGRRTSLTMNDSKFCDDMAARIQASNKEHLQEAQRQSLEEMKNMLEMHPMFRAGADKKMRLGNGEAADSDGVTVSVAPTLKKSSSRLDVEAVEAVQGISSSRNLARAGITSEAASWKETVLRDDTRYTRLVSVLDAFSGFFIILNCAWMGIECELTLEKIRNHQEMPHWALLIEIGFVTVFALELCFRVTIQGSQFFRCPNLRMNLFDMVIVGLQVFDTAFSFYNVGWLRSLRVLRLLNAGRLIRSLHHVKELRLLVSALVGSLSSLCWVMVLMVVVLYFTSVIVMQTIQAPMEEAAEVDPSLWKYYGTVGDCMLTLFMAISGGAPWETLVQPLKDISIFFVVAFLLYWTFVVCGALNIITAIFVQGMTKFVKEDIDQEVRDLLSQKDSSLNKIRAWFAAADTDGSGSLTEEELEEHLQNPEFVDQMKELHMEVWEARGLFQLLDTDALGTVGIDEFVHAMVRLKCKDQAVDLGTVMYENKRILTRLLAFMRFAEDHFKDIHRFLGMGTAGVKKPDLGTYLSEASRTTRVMEHEQVDALGRGSED